MKKFMLSCLLSTFTVIAFADGNYIATMSISVVTGESDTVKSTYMPSYITLTNCQPFNAGSICPGVEIACHLPVIQSGTTNFAYDYIEYENYDDPSQWSYFIVNDFNPGRNPYKQTPIVCTNKLGDGFCPDIFEPKDQVTICPILIPASPLPSH